MAKSASDLADTLAGLGEQIRTTAITEVRTYLAKEIKDQFCGPKATDEHVIELLDEDMPAKVRALRVRFETEGVSADFLAGILFAATVFADERYEY